MYSCVTQDVLQVAPFTFGVKGIRACKSRRRLTVTRCQQVGFDADMPHRRTPPERTHVLDGFWEYTQQGNDQSEDSSHEPPRHS